MCQENDRSRNQYCSYYHFVLSCLCLFASVMGLLAQTGGTYDLSHNVIAGGGGRSVSSQFTAEGSAGQNVAGTLSGGGRFKLRGGFWAAEQLAPTAAYVSVSGRVLTADGRGIRNTRLTLTNILTGVVTEAVSSTFGYYLFGEVRAGQSYVITISNNRFTFSDPVMVVTPTDDISEANFVADPQW